VRAEGSYLPRPKASASSQSNVSHRPIARSTIMWVYFTLADDGFENCPFRKGTKVRMRLLHNFHIRDGMIAREIGYEVWLRDE
jgi:hypothetical protein